MGFFPKVSWWIPQKSEINVSATYFCHRNEIHLFVGQVYNFWWVLLHESFHWLTNMFIFDPYCFDEINELYEKISILI